jgi:hypothetical protein
MTKLTCYRTYSEWLHHQAGEERRGAHKALLAAGAHEEARPGWFAIDDEEVFVGT